MASKRAKTTKHLVVLRFDPTRAGGPWHLAMFEDGKRVMRIGYNKEKPAVWMAAKMVSEIRKNGWPCTWDVQDEHGKSMGMDLSAEARYRRAD